MCWLNLPFNSVKKWKSHTYEFNWRNKAGFLIWRTLSSNFPWLPCLWVHHSDCCFFLYPSYCLLPHADLIWFGIIRISLSPVFIIPPLTTLFPNLPRQPCLPVHHSDCCIFLFPSCCLLPACRSCLVCPAPSFGSLLRVWNGPDPVCDPSSNPFFGRRPFVPFVVVLATGQPAIETRRRRKRRTEARAHLRHVLLENPAETWQKTVTGCLSVSQL